MKKVLYRTRQDAEPACIVLYMSTATQTPALGSTAVVIAAPGYPTDLAVEVVSVEARSIAVRNPSGTVELYTARRNGNFALLGGGQWSNYLRFA